MSEREGDNERGSRTDARASNVRSGPPGASDKAGAEASAEATASPDPYQRMVQAWTEGAKAAGDVMQQWLDTTARSAERSAGAASQAGTAATGAASDAATDPAASAQAVVSAWSEALTGLAVLQKDFFTKVAQDLPGATRARLDGQGFAQLDRMATANWEEELRRFGELPAALGERLAQADPERLAGLLQTMAREYLADLETLKGGATRLSTDSLVEPFAQVAAGTADPAARQAVDRLVEAMAVKARYGAEYYADPEATPVGQTPRECVHQEGKLKLYRYRRPSGEGVEGDAAKEGGTNEQGQPVLLVYSVINKPYILDLVPGYSFIEHLLEQGLDPYLIEWGDTEAGDRTTTLDSYIDPGIHGCVEAIRERRGVDQVPLFGHCIGGNLALMYAALHPERVSRVITLTTPVTAAEGGVVAVWTDRDVMPVDAIIDAYGHMPAKLIRYTFIALKPYYEVLKWKMFLEQLGNEDVMRLFLPVDRWANDNVDIPGLVFKKFIEEVFHDDRFRHGETRIHGERVDLGNIRCPVMNLAARRDWIVPPASATVLEDHLGTDPADYRYVEIQGAHVGIMIDPRTRSLWTDMSDFFAEG
jgi:polyhydroxyalkanoate synthase